MADGFHVASAYVTVDPDTDGFAEKLKAQLEKYDFKLTVPVGPDAAGFMAKAQADIRAQGGGKGVEVPVSPDAAGFGEKLQAAVDAGEAGVKGQPVDVPVDPDAEGFEEKLADAITRARVFVAGTGGVIIPVSYDLNEGSFARTLAAADLLAAADKTVASSSADARSGLVAAGAAATGAAASYRILGTGIRIGATAMHALISGTVEFLAVAIPATVAAGAWAAAWLQGASNVYEHIMSVYTATEAMANMGAETAGQMVGLGDALQKAQNAANPDVYQALGAAINIVNTDGGNLARTGLQVGQVFDTFLAKVAYDMQAGGANQLHSLLSGMVKDLTQLGQILGNLGHALANFASDMPGAANMLLDVADAASKAIEFISELPRPLIYAALAMHELDTWGSVAVAGLGKLGLASSELTGSFVGPTRAIGVLRNVVGLLPAAIGKVGDGLTAAGSKLPVFSKAVTAAGEGMAGFGATAGEAVAGLSGFEVVAIVGAAAGLGILIDKLLTARSAAQQFGDALQQAAQKASDLSILSVIGGNLDALQSRITVTHQVMSALTDSFKANESTSLNLAKSQHSLNEQLALQRQNLTAYHTAQVQQVSDAANVVAGASKIASVYHVSIPQAMAIAQAAGVNLSKSIVTQTGAFNALGFKVKDLMAGYAAMGQSGGALGNDMLAVAIQSGLAATKVSALNSAMDDFMHNLTGGTGSLAAFEQALTGLSTGSNTVTTILGKTKSVSLSVQQFASSLKSFTGSGAQAWQNFDQAVGSTAPQLIDWLRTAGAEGALGANGFGKFDTAVRSVVAQLLPFAAQSKTAAAEVAGLAQQGGEVGTTFQSVKQWVDSGAHSIKDLTGIVSTATVNMANMSQIAANLGNVMKAAFTSAISTASLKASGFDAAVAHLTTVLQHNAASSPAAAAAAAKVTAAWDRAQAMAGTVATKADNAQRHIDAMHGKDILLKLNTVQALSATHYLQAQIDALHGKTVDITEALSVQGARVPGLGVTTGATGGVIPGYAPGVDVVRALLSPGEGILVPEAVRGIGGAQAVHNLNRQYGGSRVSRGNKTGSFASGGITGSTRFVYPNDEFVFNIRNPVTALFPGNPLPGAGNGSPGNNNTLASELLGTGGGWGKYAKQYDAAQKARLEKDMRDAGIKLADAFADGSLKTVTEIKDESLKAIQTLQKYYQGPAATRLENTIKAQTSAMEKLATASAKVSATIAAMKSYASGITSNLASSFSSLSDLPQQTDAAGNPVAPTGASILSGLRSKLATLRQFFAAIGTLQKDKVDKSLIAQVIALGPDEGLQYAQAIIAGGASLIKQLNSVESSINSEETQIGQRAADIQYGQDISKGFLSGLTKDEAALKKKMDALGDEIAKELAKALGVPLKDITGLPKAKKKPAPPRHPGWFSPPPAHQPKTAEPPYPGWLSTPPHKAAKKPAPAKHIAHPDAATDRHVTVVQHFHGVQNLTREQLRQINTEAAHQMAIAP